MDSIICLDAEATLWGIFDPGIAPDLLFYSYLPIIFISIFLGFFVLKNGKQNILPHKIFFLFTFVYSIYLLNDILQWVSIPAGLVNFGWELIAILFILLPILLLYFVYAFITEKDAPFKYKLTVAVLCSPVVLLLPTSLNTGAFDLVNCEGSIGSLYYYIYSLMITTGVAIVFICLNQYRKQRNIEILFLMFGSVSMLILLIFADLFSEYFGNFEINLFGPIGMLLLISTLAYMIVRFEAFNIKLAGAQALVVGLIVLIGSEFFFIESTVNTILVAMTFILSCIGGYFLVKSVKKEITQREEIEKLALTLEKANERLKILDQMKSEFVSIASHQLRSPLTSIRGYASMLMEGSYGQIPQKAKGAIERIADSSAFMASSVEDYLSVSRIQAGNMKYEYSDFNLKDKVEKIVDDLRQQAVQKGLVLTFKSDMDQQGIVHADVGKTQQIVHNLINNSLKYTEKGTVQVFVHDQKKPKKIFVQITDSGIGMSKETIEKLFGKFERANNANAVNATGTGLGLYIAKKMAEDMGGDVTAHSEGEGKGSSFIFDLPLEQ